MLCASNYIAYTCRESYGTLCSKVQIQVPMIYTAASCASTEMVMLTGTDYASLKSQTSTPTSTTTVVEIPPFQVDLAGGASIATAILSVWALGFGYRCIFRLINQSDPPTGRDV